MQAGTKEIRCPGNFLDLIFLASLLLIHAACFLPIIFQIGFYLDDWATFWNLHFTPQAHNIIDLLKASFCDPRIVTRPVQCLYYATTYFFFGDRPLYYHLLNFFLEFVGAGAFYFSLRYLTNSFFIAFISACLFLLYPSHDTSHYWIGSGLGSGFGMTLFLLSYCFAIKAWISRSRFTYLSSIIFFILSIFCYEAFLPLLSLTAVSLLWRSLVDRTKNTPWQKELYHIALFLLPFVLYGIAEPVYQRVLLPHLTNTFLSPGGVDLHYFTQVFIAACDVTFGPQEIKFYLAREYEAWNNLHSVIDYLRIALIFIIFTLAAWLALKNDRKEKAPQVESGKASNTKIISLPGLLILGALICFFLSYLPFALAPGYVPTLTSIINRINMGASICLALTAACIVATIIQFVPKTYRFIVPVLIGILALKMCVTTLINWSYSSYWIKSWQAQKEIRYLVSKETPQLRPGDCVLLAGVHRYLMWAPLFDGVWDFQSMLQMTANRTDIAGGVVSDRLQIKDNKLEDWSAGYLCASYPINKTIVFLPFTQEWIHLKSANQFIELIKQNSKSCDLSPDTLTHWHQQSHI